MSLRKPRYNGDFIIGDGMRLSSLVGGRLFMKAFCAHCCCNDHKRLRRERKRRVGRRGVIR